MREKERGGERESDRDGVGVRGIMKREKRDRIERNLILISILAYPYLTYIQLMNETNASHLS